MIIKHIEEKDKDKTIFSPQIEIFSSFSEHTENSRQNMNAKQLTQVVVSKNTEPLQVIDKKYTKLTEVPSPYSMVADEDGMVLMRMEELLIIYGKESQTMRYFHIPRFKKLINNSLSLKYVVSDEKTIFKKGDLLWDYTNTIPDINIPRIGYRANILYASFFGFCSDDALVISESFSKKAQIEYSEKIFIPVAKNMRFIKNGDKYLPGIGEKLDSETLISYNFIDNNEYYLSEVVNLDNKTESKYFSRVIKGIKDGTIENIKIHLNTKEDFSELKEKYLYSADFMEELEFYYNQQQEIKKKLLEFFNKLGLPEDTVNEYTENIFNQYFQMNSLSKNILKDIQDQYNIDPDSIDFLIEIDMSLTKHTTRGDKFTNLHAGKGTVSLIIPDEVMPKDPKTGKPFDIIFNPLGIFGRNNWGMLFELATGKVISDVELTISENNLELAKEKIEFIINNFIELYDKEYASDTRNILENNFDELIEDIKKNKFYLFVPNFPGLTYNDFMSKFIIPYQEKFQVNLTEKEKIHFSNGLITYLRHLVKFDSNVFQKVDIESLYEQDVSLFYGNTYITKLYHTSSSKHNSVSFTNSYSKTTGQPTRGRKKSGGQHLSWQSTNALLSHIENNGILKEFFTFKSDSREEKESFLMKLIKDGEYIMKPKYHSNTKKTINSALKMIGMSFDK